MPSRLRNGSVFLKSASALPRERKDIYAYGVPESALPSCISYSSFFLVFGTKRGGKLGKVPPIFLGPAKHVRAGIRVAISTKLSLGRV